MIKKLLLSLGVIFFCIGFAYAQESTVKGTVKDSKNQPLAYSGVTLKQEGRAIARALTDDEGNYQVFSVSPGVYNIEVTGPAGLGCAIQILTDVRIAASEVKFLEFVVECGVNSDGKVLGPVEIKYQAPIFEVGKTTQGERLTGDDLNRMPGRSISAALSNMASMSSVDGEILSVRGNRSDGQQVIVDGVRMRGGSSPLMQTVEEIEMIQGGIPAEYGDGTSFTVITTKGIQKDYHGAAELRGSIDGYNNFLGSVLVSGPIAKDKEGGRSKVGFMLSGEGYYNTETRPARGGVWVVKEDVLDEVTKNPLRYDPVNFGASYAQVNYLKEDDFEKRRVSPGKGSYGVVAQGKLDFIPLKDNTMRISLTGSYNYGKGKGPSSVLFYQKGNSGESIGSSARVALRLNHRVYRNDTSLLKNIMYDINVSYSKTNSLSQNARFKDNIFAYGHIGTFKVNKANSYTFYPTGGEGYTVDGMTYYDVYVLDNIYDSLVTFVPGPHNPDLANYTTNFLENFSPEILNDFFGYQVPYNFNTYRQFGALLNGEMPSSLYGLHSGGSLPGTPASGTSYGKSESDAFVAKVSLSMNIGNHDIKLGYDFDRYSSRSFGVNPYALWSLMRTKQNAHAMELANKEGAMDYVLRNDTFFFNRTVNLDAQSVFDRNLREKLGLDPNGDTWLDIDNLDPEMFDLGMFSAEELLVGTGGSLISYYGYDYTGQKKNKKKTDIADFFNGTDEQGRKTYNIGAFEPVYMAVYLQDKFSINNLLFNVGVRIDRFDANQSVLKDPYLFREAHTVGSITSQLANGAESPFVSNAKDNWVVYVSEKDKTLDLEGMSIAGYRDGTTWYNKQGQEVSDGEKLIGMGGPILLRELDRTSITKVEAEAFEDYKAQWSVMPRLSFSFPVSENSLFTAHYNIVTLRPTNNQLSPISYLFIDQAGTSLLPNPNLKNQKSIDYEIGFSQKLGEKSALSINAYYSEKRDQIQSFRLTGAYPNTYYSYLNQDFGTVQGFSFKYMLRRTKNVQLTASYTIQFAKGTGSNASSQSAIIHSGQPNLRTLTNLDFDQRHRLNASLDYRFEGGTQYNGPKSTYEKDGKQKSIQWLANTGINVVFSAASGRPYSKAAIPSFGGGNAKIAGSINGANRPWTFQCDVKIDKSIALNLAKKDSEGKKNGYKPGYLQFYVDITNIFNFKNILNVYSFTGRPDDDGYLAASEFQQNIKAQVDEDAFRNYYRMAINNPYNYGMPTRASFGIQFQF